MPARWLAVPECSPVGYLAGSMPRGKEAGLIIERLPPWRQKLRGGRRRQPIGPPTDVAVVAINGSAGYGFNLPRLPGAVVVLIPSALNPDKSWSQAASAATLAKGQASGSR